MRYQLSHKPTTNVATYQNRVYATHTTGGRTDIHEYTFDVNWLGRHIVDMTSEAGWMTLSARGNDVTCCSTKNGKIGVLTTSGQLRHAYGEPGSGGAGHLSMATICDDDDDGSVLLADNGNGRLQVMSERGEFSVLRLQPPPPQPSAAVLFNNCLFVTSARSKAITKYKQYL